MKTECHHDQPVGDPCDRCFGGVAVAGPSWLSFSQATMFEQCPAKWEFQYLLDVKDESGPEARRGLLVHAALEHLVLLPPAERTPETAVELVRTLWPAGACWEAVDSDRFLHRAAWVNLMRSLRLPEVVDPEVVATELRFKVVLEGVPFTGLIDEVAHGDRGLVVRDWKDGSRSNYADAKAAKKRQVINYSAAVPLATDLDRPRDAEVVWTAESKVDRYPVTDRAVETATGWLRGVWDDIQTARSTGQFEHRPGPLCSWCPAVGQCPDGLDNVRERVELGKRIGDHGRLALETENNQEAA